MEAEILENIKSGVYELINKRKGRSAIWNVLAEIKKDDGSYINGYVGCRTCQKILKFNGKQTSNLLHHKCVLNFSQEITLEKVENHDKKQSLEICAKWVVEDCRPFSAVDGEGFKKMIKFFIDIGAKYGSNVDIADLIPTPCSISRRLNSLAQENKEKLKAEINEVVTQGKAAVTTDMWTDNYVKRSFVCATLQYQKDFFMKEIVLGVKSMDFMRATGDNIKNKLIDLCSEFGILSVDQLVFISDRGANIKNALSNYTRLNCANHLFANVLDAAFTSTPDLQPLIIACRKLVKYFKKANVQHLLKTTLKNYCPTRWYSHLSLFKSISDNWTKINEILTESSEINRICNININLLNALCELCVDFDLISKKLQTTTTPSICFVLPSITGVRKICEPSQRDPVIIKQLKQNILLEVEKTWVGNLNILHKIAFFLYPPANRMQEKDIEEIKTYLIDDIYKTQNVEFNDPVEETPTNIAVPSPIASDNIKSAAVILPRFVEFFKCRGTRNCHQ